MLIDSCESGDVGVFNSEDTINLELLLIDSCESGESGESGDIGEFNSADTINVGLYDFLFIKTCILSPKLKLKQRSSLCFFLPFIKEKKSSLHFSEFKQKDKSSLGLNQS